SPGGYAANASTQPAADAQKLVYVLLSNSRPAGSSEPQQQLAIHGAGYAAQRPARYLQRRGHGAVPRSLGTASSDNGNDQLVSSHFPVSPETRQQSTCPRAHVDDLGCQRYIPGPRNGAAQH